MINRSWANFQSNWKRYHPSGMFSSKIKLGVEFRKNFHPILKIRGIKNRYFHKFWMMCTHGSTPSRKLTLTCALEPPWKWCNPLSWRCQNKSDENAFIRSWIEFNFPTVLGCVGAHPSYEENSWRSHLSNCRCVRQCKQSIQPAFAGGRRTHRQQLYMTDWVTKLCSLTLMFMLMEISSSRAVACEARRNKFWVCFGLMVPLIGRIWWRLEVLIIRKV